MYLYIFLYKKIFYRVSLNKIEFLTKYDKFQTQKMYFCLKIFNLLQISLRIHVRV